MTEKHKKSDPWGLIAILVIVGALFVGLYITNLNIDARFNSLEITVSANAAALDLLTRELLDKKADQKSQKAESAEPQTPAEASSAATNGGAEAEGDADGKENAETAPDKSGQPSK